MMSLEGRHERAEGADHGRLGGYDCVGYALVRLYCGRPEFKHSAHDHDERTPAAQHSGHLECGRERRRIGIVRVIEHREPARPKQLAAPVRQGDRLERLGDALDVESEHFGECQHQHRVLSLVPSEQWNAHTLTAEDQLGSTDPVQAPAVGTDLRTVPEARARRRNAQCPRPLDEVRWIRPDHGTVHTVQNEQFLLEHRFQRSEPLHMPGGDVRDDGGGRGDDPAQSLDLAALARSSLDHECVGIIWCRENGQRHPDLVVEVGTRRMDGPPHAKSPREQLLGGGLPVGTGDPHHRSGHVLPPPARQPAQCG